MPYATSNPIPLIVPLRNLSILLVLALSYFEKNKYSLEYSINIRESVNIMIIIKMTGSL